MLGWRDVTIAGVLWVLAAAVEKARYNFDAGCRVTCPVAPCRVERLTDRCVAAHSAVNSSEAAAGPCAADVLDFEPELFLSQLVAGFPSPGLNLAVVLRDPSPEKANGTAFVVDAVKLRVQCVVHQDDFCLMGSKSKRNLTHWPCRLFDWGEAVEPTFPIRLEYKCMKLMPNAPFTVDVSLYSGGHKRCENTYFMELPSSRHIPGRLAEPSDWLPAAFVDVNGEDGVVVRHTAVPPDLRDNVTLRVRLSRVVGSLHAPSARNRNVSAMDVPRNKTGVRFRGLVAGLYFADIRPVFAFPGAQNSDGSLKGHKITVFFNLTEDKFAETPLTELAFTDMVPVVLALLGVSIITILVIVVCVVFRRSRSGSGRSPVSFLELRARPTVLLIYTDDHEAQRGAVRSLAEYLRAHANCEVLLDAWELELSGQAPDAWYFSAFARADRFLLLLSPAAHQALQGRALVNSRHWVDMYATLVQMLLRRIREEIGARGVGEMEKPLGSVAWVSLDHHAVALPDHFRLLPVRHHRLPSHLRHLICHLHGLDACSVAESEALYDDAFRDAAVAANAWEADHPGWLQRKLLPLEPSNELARLPPLLSSSPKASHPPIQLADADFPLLPPEEEEPEEEETFTLLAPPPDSDDDLPPND